MKNYKIKFKKLNYEIYKFRNEIVTDPPALLVTLFFQLPKSNCEWMAVADQFLIKWNFPHSLGNIDGKHVQTITPESSDRIYFNYKGTFSIVLLGVANATYNFIYADVGCQGRISDGGVFKYTSLYEKIEQGKLNLPADETLPGRTNPVSFVFVADDAFALATHIMKPYPGHKSGASSP